MKILHLEDNLLDAELLRGVLLREWPGSQVTQVDSRADFVDQLPAGYDLILSDFTLVNFNGLEALELARRNVPDVPFIFLSGTIGEDRALEALRAGASDYVLKDRPRRLLPAIDRALNDAKLRQERRMIDEQVRRVQRLENISMISAGIAHDFNQVLTPVLMGMSLLRARLPGESDRQFLDGIESSAQQGAVLVRRILDFAHGVTGEPQLVQPRQLLHELIGIIAQTFPRNIRLQDDIAAGLWPLKASPIQIHQVLMNLCVNARDAMPDGGTLRVRAANRTLDQTGVAAIPDARPGPHLLLEVTDTGTGIAPALLDRIWEPFFTTKGAEHGPGLGLATVRAIVHGHGGAITLQTRPGAGTTFQIFLPALPGFESVAAGVAAASPHRGEGELILVVDGDAGVRDLASATLTSRGYRVLAAADGTEALALFAPRSLEVRVLVTDFDVPELDGHSLTKVVRALNPSIRVLMVGAQAGRDDSRRRPPLANRFLAKPFKASLLLEKIHDLLHSASASPV